MQAARVKRARVRANVELSNERNGASVEASDVIVIDDADDSVQLALLVSEPEAADSGELKYRKFLFREWALGRLSDKALCDHAFYSTGAEARGVTDLAVNPGTKGYNHKRVISAALEDFWHPDEWLYHVNDVPTWSPNLNRRVKRTVPIRLPLEALDQAFVAEPILRTVKLDPSDITPHMRQHPLALEHGLHNLQVCRMYADKVPVFKKQSMYRKSISIIGQRERYASWVMLDSQLCKCGCKGRCTTDALDRAMHWSINCAQRGVRPGSRHDRSNFHPDLDSSRIARANHPLHWRIAIVEWGGDWPEECYVGGFKHWNSHQPCTECKCTPEDFLSPGGAPLVPWVIFMFFFCFVPYITNLQHVHTDNIANRCERLAGYVSACHHHSRDIP